MTKQIFDFRHLSASERIQLAQDLWDSVADAPEVEELTEEQRDELERRVEAYRRDPGETVPWSRVREELLGRD